MPLQYSMIPGIHCVWFLGMSPFFAYVAPTHKLDEAIRVLEGLSRFTKFQFDSPPEEILPWCGNV
jgi:hypothetical protein